MINLMLDNAIILLVNYLAPREYTGGYLNPVNTRGLGFHFLLARQCLLFVVLEDQLEK